MIKQSLAVILSLALSGCVNLKYNNGITMIDQGSVKERGIIQSTNEFFNVPITSSPKILDDGSDDGSGKGVFFTLSSAGKENTYVVSGTTNDLSSLNENLGKYNKVTFEFYPRGGYRSLPDINSSTNRYYLNCAIPRENCQFTFQNISTKK